ncbi:MAG: MOSC domain-containing protein [Thermoleophilia bacterium]|nr:MOSC domain-containing protein [Thermoleophilia bacterium]
MSNIAGDVGSVAAVWRYPVKSMMGEALNAAEVTERGLLGDRPYALVDAETGKVVSAKKPRKWEKLFEFRASFVEPPLSGQRLPHVRITFPDGRSMTTVERGLDEAFSDAFGRRVTFATAAPDKPSLEEYWPDLEGLTYRETVTDEAMPEGTFFDLGLVHVLTTATLNRLRELHPPGRYEVRRFRPNIVVASTGSAGFVENDWVDRTLAIGEKVRLRVTGPCPRCVKTTLPQDDLPKDPGILRAAAQHNDANVGVYASVEQDGAIRRGDSVKLL